MTNSEKAEVYELLQNLADLYSSSVSERKISAYSDYLQDLSFGAVKAAIRKAAGRFKTFPSAGELRGLCGGDGGGTGAPGWKATKEYLKATYGDDYYEKDYEEGVRMGINRPVSEVIADEIARGWRPRPIEDAMNAVEDVFFDGDMPPEAIVEDRWLTKTESKEKLREIMNQLNFGFPEAGNGTRRGRSSA